MSIKITLNAKAIKSIENAAIIAAKNSIEELKTDVENSKTMPFDMGDMQNNQTFAATSEGGAKLVTSSPQARRLYYNPQYNFQQGNNPNAGGRWLDTYIDGEKQDFVKEHFERIFKKEAKL